MTRDEFREAAEVVEGLRVSLWLSDWRAVERAATRVRSYARIMLALEKVRAALRAQPRLPDVPERPPSNKAAPGG